MPAVSTVILRSMRMTGEKGRGATLTSDEAVECLAELNTFIESLQTERLMCYSVTEDTAALTASTSTYTIGNGGAINTARPTKIVDPCFVRDSSGYDTPVSIVNLEAYGHIVDKAAGYTVPNVLYYDYGFSATSTGTISLYPVPSGGLTLHINSWKQLQSFPSVTTLLLFPPGYQLMIESNFAIHLAAGVLPVTPELARIARDSKAAVKSLNAPAPVMQLGPLSAYGSSILTGP